MPDGPSKNLIFPDAWEQQRRKLRARDAANKRKGVSLIGRAKIGSIAERVDSQFNNYGPPILITNERTELDEYDEVQARYTQAVILRVREGQLTYNPVEVIEIERDARVRITGGIQNHRLLAEFLRPFHSAQAHRAVLESWGLTTQQINSAIILQYGRR